MEYAKVNSDAFEQIQKEAGMILKSFDPTGKTEIQDADILFITTGGVNPKCTPTTEDFGADIDNVPDNTKELLQITGYDCGITFTAVNVTPESVKRTLGCADITTLEDAKAGLTVSKITPREEVKSADFSDLWFVAPMTGGGFCACVLKNALSDSGFGIKTTKKGKGNVEVSIKGYRSLTNQEEVPMEFYVAKKTA